MIKLIFACITLANLCSTSAHAIPKIRRGESMPAINPLNSQTHSLPRHSTSVTLNLRRSGIHRPHSTSFQLQQEESFENVHALLPQTYSRLLAIREKIKELQKSYGFKSNKNGGDLLQFTLDLCEEESLSGSSTEELNSSTEELSSCNTSNNELVPSQLLAGTIDRVLSVIAPAISDDETSDLRRSILLDNDQDTTIQTASDITNEFIAACYRCLRDEVKQLTCALKPLAKISDTPHNPMHRELREIYWQLQEFNTDNHG